MVNGDTDKNDNFQLPNLNMFNGDTLTKMTTSNFRTFTYFQLPNLTNSNFQLQDIYLLPTSKSDKNDNFQLPNLHLFNGDTLTKMPTSNFRTFTYFQLPNLTYSNFQLQDIYLLPTSKSTHVQW